MSHEELQRLVDIGKANLVTIGIIERVDKKTTTVVSVQGHKVEGNPLSTIALLCEGIGFMLSGLRQAIRKGEVNMSKEEFTAEVERCKRHIELACIDYNQNGGIKGNLTKDVGNAELLSSNMEDGTEQKDDTKQTKDD